MTLQEQLRPLLAQYSKATGRGNMILANETLSHIIHSMAVEIDRGCGCCKPQEKPVIESPVVEIKRGRGRPPKNRA